MSAVRIGPAMFAALRYVKDNDGAPDAWTVALAVGPHGSSKYGYRTVNRCVAAELLAIDPKHPKAAPRSNGAVVLTPAGTAALAAHDEAARS